MLRHRFFLHGLLCCVGLACGDEGGDGSTSTLGSTTGTTAASTSTSSTDADTSTDVASASATQGTTESGSTTEPDATTSTETSAATETGVASSEGSGDGGVAGTCGWDDLNAYYACGFVGAEPNGLVPIECPDGLVEGEPCELTGLDLAGCCDANGDNWYCEDTVVRDPC